MQAGIGYIFKVWELSDADGNRRHTVERNAKVLHSDGQRLGGKPILEAGLWFSRCEATVLKWTPTLNTMCK